MEQPKKWYIIIGGTSGIGLQTATDIHKRGDGVVLVGSSRKKMDRVLNALPGALGVCCDLRSPESLGDVFGICRQKDIIFSGMVYCAGVSPQMSVAENDCRVMQDTFSVNFFSFVEAVKWFQTDGIASEEATIVAISSISASQSVNRQCVYAGSKAAMEAAVRCMAKELMLRRIRINALALGAVRTEMLAELEKNHPSLLNRYPLGAIPPEQVSEAIRYLLSDKAAHISGSIIKMDSGHDAWLR